MSESEHSPEDEPRDTHVWWCEFCTEHVGTKGDEPEDCPMCGNSDGWNLLVEEVTQ